ncbi:unannotated protein [freshwater metagenome]|uniref:Unannotated protein n=1 Tax=freshwater metagenome TaxID=449393 RepID=A0A6J6DZQ7_9ZZZZ
MVTNLIGRILIVGQGAMGLRHLAMARKLFPKAQIKILAKNQTSELIKLSDGYLEKDELQYFAPQVAVIASPAPFHIEMALKLARAGIHLLIEKPLSSSTERVVELIELARENKLTLMTGYNLRFSSSLMHFKELIEKRILGKVLSVRCEVGQYLPDWRANKDYRTTVSANYHLGGGVLLELSHEIDYLRWIFGELDWVNATLTKQSDLEIDVEDSAHLTLGFEANSAGHQIVANLNLDFIRHDRTRSCTAICETGTIKWDGTDGSVKIYDPKTNSWKEVVKNGSDIEETLMREWENFIDSVTNVKDPLVTGLDGLRVLEIVEAARESATEGSRVKVIKAYPVIDLKP